MTDIRLGDARDIAAIMPVMDNAFEPKFAEAWTAAQCLASLALPGTQLLLATNNDGAITGFALSRAVMNEEELLLIGVLPEQRRQGIGQELIRTLLRNASAAYRTTVFLEVRDGNSAQYFYRQMGFLPIGRRPRYYRSTDGDYYDAITMAVNF